MADDPSSPTVPVKGALKRPTDVNPAEQTTSSKRVRFNSTSNVEFKYEKEPEVFVSNTGENVDQFGRLLISRNQHTLDSDEELDDDDKTLDVGKVRNFVEKKTIAYDGDTKITPFNLDDELEEGTFDTEGNFVFNKKDDESKDAWADSINWDQIEKETGEGTDEVALSPEVEEKPVDPSVILKALIYVVTILRPDQSLTKLFSYLNSSRLSNAEERRLRFEAKRNGTTYCNPITQYIEYVNGLVSPALDIGVIELDMTKRQVEAALTEYKESVENSVEDLPGSTFWEVKLKNKSSFITDTQYLAANKMNFPAETVCRVLNSPDDFVDIQGADLNNV
ncbi:hypothetical protein FO519_000725 [Halicephalobus sp. NKZ332]|nr:hypothetical protein FO519_000725 [Halicephalobus sp. NKZ332]